MQNFCDGTYSFAPQRVTITAWHALTLFAGIFGSVKNFGVYLHFLPQFKRYICAEADTVWSDDWWFGMWVKEGRERVGKEGEEQ